MLTPHLVVMLPIPEIRDIARKKNFRLKSLKKIFDSANSRVPIPEEDESYEVYMAMMRKEISGWVLRGL